MVTDRAALATLTEEIVACRACPRLVAWREQVARDKVARFRDEVYWGRPLPGFGDPDGRILLLGLAFVSLAQAHALREIRRRHGDLPVEVEEEASRL